MAKKQCFMPFFYDWCTPFSALNGNDAKKLLLAMVTYYRNGGEIPEFTGKAKIAADFVFPQLERTRQAIQQRTEAGIRSADAARERKATNSQRTATTNTNTNTNTNTTPTLPNVGEEVESRFAVFWEKYPRKQNKVKAWEVWKKLDPDTALLDRMLTALEDQMTSSSWRADGGIYIPSPSSWLYQRRWEDEPTTISPPPNNNGSTFDTDEFFRAALRRSMSLMDQTLPTDP